MAAGTDWALVIRYDPIYRVYFVTNQKLCLRTPIDVDRYYDAVDAALARCGDNLDLLIDLGGLVLEGPATVARFNERRAGITRRYVRRSRLFGGRVETRVTFRTSSIVSKDKVNARVFNTREEALASLLNDRIAKGDT